MRRLFSRLFWTLLAAVFLVEAWLWDVLGAALSRLAAFLPIDPVRRGLTAVLRRTPPVFALLLFAIPALVILPFKLAGLALLAKGRFALGAAVFLLAKTAGLGVTAFVFDVCRERLMLMRWFVRLYDAVIAARDWAHRQVDPYKEAIRRLRETILPRAASGSPPFLRRLLALRAKARRPA